MSKPVVTGEMVTAFRVAFDDESKRTDYLNYNGSIRVGIEAALSASPAEPVAYASMVNLRSHAENPGEMFLYGSKGTFHPDNEVPLYLHPVPAETERMREVLESAIAWIITLGGNPHPDDTNADQIQIAVLASLRAALGRKP